MATVWKLLHMHFHVEDDKREKFGTRFNHAIEQNDRKTQALSGGQQGQEIFLQKSHVAI